MIAQVAVDTGVPHLDHPFDYTVPESMQDQVRVGIRVKVRFSGRSLPGFVVSVSDSSDQDKLVPISSVVSTEQVMPPSSVELIRAVADHCAGTFMDVARLAIPPRVAKAEKAGDTAGSGEPLTVDPGEMGEPQPVSLDSYPAGTSLRQAVRQGKSPRVAWTLVPVCAPVGDWADGLAGLAADTLLSGRSALILVPDAKDCARAVEAASAVVGGRHVVSLSADKGPQARYSAFLAAERGQARVLVGTRAAVYTPMDNLGLITVWEEADASFAEPHFPYPALRDIVAIRASQVRAGVVFASYSRSTPIQNWVEKGWLREISMPGPQTSFLAPLVRAASQDDRSLDRDPAARVSRLPHDAFTAIRTGLESGPVLVWVPWLGNRRNFMCSQCGQPMRCACGGGFEETSAGVVCCRICGASATQWRCACGSTRWRAVTIGSARTAEELASAFKNHRVVRSDSAHRVDSVDPVPSIVISTPGCEPHAESGYAAAVILDAAGFLSRPDIDVAEEAVRRWLAAISLVRPGKDGGSAWIVGPGGDRAIQAVLRIDPVGFAARELEDRRQAGFPPATRMATFTSDEAGLDEVAQTLSAAGYVEMLGPLQQDESDQSRLIARVPASRGEDFARLLQTMASGRSQGKRTSKLTWRLDPDWLGG